MTNETSQTNEMPIWNNANFKDKLDGVISLTGYDGRFMTTPPVTNGGQLLSYHGYIWLGGKTNQANLDILAQCTCCSRHQTYKPTRYEPWNNNNAHPDSRYGHRQNREDDDCLCECRHFARLICRMCDE